MDKIIDARFQRVEKSLQTLITSISTYNPTPAHATDLLTADAELNQGLEQLSQHQRNYEKILALRNTSNNLDNQIRETLILLTNTRRTLINTTSTIYPETTNPVTYSELLSYARKISKQTIPPTYRDTNDTGGTSSPSKDKSEPHSNGTTTPTIATNGSNGVPETNGPVLNNGMTMEIDSATPSNVGGAQPGEKSQDTTSSTELPQEWQLSLNPRSTKPWFPWPTEHDIKRGALANIQVLLDRGEDPATFDPERGAELEAERQRIMDEEERVKEEEMAKVESERKREMERRLSVSGAAARDRREERPKVFQLETFDDDDDSE